MLLQIQGKNRMGWTVMRLMQAGIKISQQFYVAVNGCQRKGEKNPLSSLSSYFNIMLQNNFFHITKLEKKKKREREREREN